MNQAIERLTAAPLEHLGQRVITLGAMDEVHERPSGTAGRAFRAHRQRMVEGRHYFRSDLGSDVFRRTSGRGDDVLLTERGYLVLVKTFRDDLAWQVQEELVEGYFRARAVAPGSTDALGAISARLDRIEQGFVYNGLFILLRDQSAVLRRLERLERISNSIHAEAVKARRRRTRGARQEMGFRDRRRIHRPAQSKTAPGEKQLELASRQAEGEG